MKLSRFITATFAVVMLTTTMLTAQEERIVLIEDFSSATCVNCPAASQKVLNVLKDNAERVVVVEYHLDIPARKDPFYALNKEDPDEREKFYTEGGQFDGLPQIFIGGIFVSGTNEGQMRAEVASQLAQESPLKMTLMQEQSETATTVTITVSSTVGVPNGQRIFAAVVEGFVKREESFFRDYGTQSYNRQTEFHNLFREFASPREGEEISVGPGGSQQFMYTVPHGETWNPDELFVVAWVQDDFTLDVTQAGASKPTSSVRDFSSVAGYDLAVAPNPTTGPFVVDLTLGDPAPVEITIVDALGREVYTASHGTIASGEHRLPVDIGEAMPDGYYRVVVRAGDLVSSEDIVRIGR